MKNGKFQFIGVFDFHVFPNQSADWCGDPLQITHIATDDGDCHTSDIGHWFATTCKKSPFNCKLP